MWESVVIVQVSCQSSSSGQSVLVQGMVQASCLDHSTSCLETILEQSPFEILLQRTQLHASSRTSHKQSSQPLQSTRDILDASSACLLISLPRQPGLSVLIRCITLPSRPKQPIQRIAQAGMKRQQSLRPSFRCFFVMLCCLSFTQDTDQMQCGATWMWQCAGLHQGP